MIAILASIPFLVCSVLAYGLTFGHYQGLHPHMAWTYRRRDRHLAFVVALLGPLGLATIAFLVITDGEPFRWQVLSRSVPRRA